MIFSKFVSIIIPCQSQVMLKSSQYTQICHKQNYNNFLYFCKISLKLSNVENSRLSPNSAFNSLIFKDLTSQINCPIIQLKSTIQLGGVCYLLNPKYPIVYNPKFSHNFKIYLSDLQQQQIIIYPQKLYSMVNGQFYPETWRDYRTQGEIPLNSGEIIGGHRF